MPRRRRKKLSVSLFPFLSILACVIGTLTLMITALALGQMDTEAVDVGLKLDYIDRQIKEFERFIEQLEAKIAEVETGTDDTKKALAEAIAELERLKRIKDSLSQTDKDDEETQVDVPTVDEEAHKKRLAEIDEEIKSQEEQKKELAAQVEERENPDEAEVIIQPGGSGVNLKPTFVECTTADVVIYEDDPPKRVRLADLKTDQTFLALLDRISADPDSTVIFLVRDDALGAYFSASAVARSRYARNGKLPVIGHGKIDVSLFKK